MRLTTFTDYCLRVLMHVAVREGGSVTIDEIAESYGISRNHLMKVVSRLGQLGYLATARGRGGGVRLAMQPSEINLGRLVRQTEEDMALVECFQSEGTGCVVAPCCRLKGVLREALAGFLAVLDGYTLADLVGPRRQLARLLNMAQAG